MSKPEKPMGSNELVSTGALQRLNLILVRALEVLAILALTALVLDVVWGVVTRYVLGEQAKWTEELARFLLIWVSMLGGALAFRRRDHLGIDLLVGSMHTDVANGMQRLKQGIVVFAAIAVFLYGGGRIVFDALAAAQTTPALGWKMGYVYSAVPLAGIFILLFAVEEMLAPDSASKLNSFEEEADAMTRLASEQPASEGS